MHNTAARLDTRMSKVLMKGGYFGAIGAGQWRARQGEFPWKLNGTVPHCPSTPLHPWAQAAFKVKCSGSLSNTQAIILLHNTGLHSQLTTNIKGSIIYFFFNNFTKGLSKYEDIKQWWQEGLDEERRREHKEAKQHQPEKLHNVPPTHPHFPLPFSPFPLQVADEMNWMLGKIYPGKETKVCIGLNSREKHHAWKQYLKKRQYEKWN